MKHFSYLSDSKFKILGLAITIFAMAILILLHILNYEYEEGWRDRILIINHLIVILGLYMIMYSKEKHDDERVQRIRYVLLKLVYTLTVSGILIYVSVTTLDRVALSVYIILYIIEAALILYQLMFRYSLAKNPTWIYKERRRSNFRFYYLSFSLIFLLGWIVYVVIHYKL